MAEKKTHFGRAGEFFAMSELLLRGWNVAVPVVDVGDDVFVIDDNDKATRRLQVKSSEGKTSEENGEEHIAAHFTLSRRQLSSPQAIELFYMLLVRVRSTWRFLVLPRTVLSTLREIHVERQAVQPRAGRRHLADAHAKSDALALKIVLLPNGATGWGAPLTQYLDTWPEELATVEGGPGARTR